MQQSLVILGHDIPIRIMPSISNAVRFNGSEVQIYCKTPDNDKLLSRLLLKWQNNYMEETFQKLSRDIYPIFEELGVKYPAIRYRNMKSRWGSCQPYNSVITFNTLLMEKPIEAVEYVVLHEFVHFIVPNHSKDFYSFVEKYMPDWKIRKKPL